MTAGVAWEAWGTAAFARAQAEARPVLLSIGASWSAACRALEDELFGAAAAGSLAGSLAELVRESTVPVRVDADRRPDIAERYTQGGWPTLVLLTPEGEILAGGAGLDAAHLRELIGAAVHALATRRRDLALRADTLRQERRASSDPPDTTPAPELSPDPSAPRTSALGWMAATLHARFDPLHGGFLAGEDEAGLEKFPHAAPLAFALWHGARVQDARLVHLAVTTLDRMAAGGLSSADGAFHRCCAGPDWSVPDAAKLLETQAELIPLYIDAWTLSGVDAFRDRALACLAFVFRTLTDEVRGGFFASQAPDGSVDRVLLTDANAKMVCALVRAGRVLEDARLIERAARALERLLPVVYQRRAGVAHLLLPDADEGDTAQVRGLLTDQVAASTALLDAGLVGGEPVYVELAEELMRSALRRFAHPGGGLLDRVRSSAGAGDLGLLGDPHRPFATNAAAARVLLRLGRDAGRPDLLAASEATLQPLLASYRRHGLASADLGLALLEASEDAS